MINSTTRAAFAAATFLLISNFASTQAIAESTVCPIGSFGHKCLEILPKYTGDSKACEKIMADGCNEQQPNIGYDKDAGESKTKDDYNCHVWKLFEVKDNAAKSQWQGYAKLSRDMAYWCRDGSTPSERVCSADKLKNECETVRSTYSQGSIACSNYVNKVCQNGVCETAQTTDYKNVNKDSSYKGWLGLIVKLDRWCVSYAYKP